jgi:hypothetical protein
MTTGVLLKEMNLVEDVLLCQAKDIEKGFVQITCNDITAGLPCRESAYLAFDHYSDQGGMGMNQRNHIVDTNCRSTSRVVYNYFGHDRFNRVPRELLNVVDKVTCADITLDDILYPSGWMLLSHLIDHRTALDRYTRFSLSTAMLMETLIDWCREYTVWEVLSLPPIEERSTCYFANVGAYKLQIMQCATVHKNLVIVDLRNKDIVYPGNRFMIYALFPECNVSLQIIPNHAGTKTTIAVGKSFLDRSLTVDIGKAMRECGGGGNRNAGACDVDNDRVDIVVSNLINTLQYGMFKNLFMGYYNYYYP